MVDIHEAPVSTNPQMIRQRVHRPRRYSREELGLPAILMTVMWGAIWLLWPWKGIHDPVAVRTPTATRVVCTVAPYDPCVPGFGPGEFPHPDVLIRSPPAEDSIPSSLSGAGTLSPSFLAYSAESLAPTGGLSSVQVLSAQARKAMGEYAPFIRQPRPAGVTNAGHSELFYVVLGDLKECGFGIPEAAMNELLLKSRDSWQVTVSVEVNREGWPEHVFLENSCGMRDIDAAVIRALHAGRGSGGEDGRHGRVTVSQGSP